MDYRYKKIVKKKPTKSARHFFISQPSLTNRLKHMQEELDVKIGRIVKRLHLKRNHGRSCHDSFLC